METKELNEKMKEFTENAVKFTLDGGISSLYDYKEQGEETTENNTFHLKSFIGN